MATKKDKKVKVDVLDQIGLGAPKQEQEDPPKAEGQEAKEDPPKTEENSTQEEEKKIRYRKDGKPRKNNAGRNAVKQPGQYHTTNVDILKENYQFYMRNKLVMGGTLAAYINRLISADLAKNGERYEQMTKELNNF